MRFRTLLLSLLLVFTIGFSVSISTDAPLALADEENPAYQSFELSFLGATQTITLSDLGVIATENEEYSAWHAFWENAFANIALFDSKIVNGKWNYTWISNISDLSLRNTWGIERPVNAYYTSSEGTLGIQTEVDGVLFDIDTLINEITSNYPNFGTYSLVSTQAGLIQAEHLEEKYELVNSLLFEGILMTDGEEEYHFPAQIKDLEITKENNGVSIQFDEPYLEYLSLTLSEFTDEESSDLTLTEVDTSQVSRFSYEGNIYNGRELDSEATKAAIQSAVENDETQIEVIVNTIPGLILNETGEELVDFEHITTGKSNYYGSDYGRIFNVEKALDEHLDGIYIPEGAEFSFNDQLGGPVTYSKGWAGAYAIFGGDELVTVPGGGICQTSTTVYRAALLSGMDIQQQRHHSMYVSYYAKYGNGLDATIYPPSNLDFKFVNNSGAPMIMFARHDNWDAYVDFYGVPDGRSVEMYGPYTRSNQTEEVTAEYGRLGSGQIVWKQEITWADGSLSENWIRSSYNTYVPQY